MGESWCCSIEKLQGLPTDKSGKYQKTIPIWSMYRILTNIGGTVLINVGKYVIDGAYGIGFDMIDYVGDG